MASGVSLGAGAIWWAPGVYADRLFTAARRRVRPDSPLDAELATAIGAGPLQLEVLPPPLAAELRRLLVDTASAQVAALEQVPGPSEWDIGYANALRWLSTLLTSACPVVPSRPTPPTGDELAGPAAAGFVARLVQAVAGLDEGLRLHIHTYGGLYPRTLLRSLAYVVLDMWRGSDPRERSQAVWLLRVLERECAADAQVDAAIGVFVRSLAGADVDRQLVTQLGPRLRGLLDRV